MKKTYFEDHLVIDCHAIIRLYPLLAKVDSSAGPVCVAVVYGNENDVLFKDIELQRDMTCEWAISQNANDENTFFVHLASRAASYPSLNSLGQKKVLKYQQFKGWLGILDLLALPLTAGAFSLDASDRPRIKAP